MLRRFKQFNQRLRRELAVFKPEITGIINDRKEYQRQPQNLFTEQGYEVIPDFLDKQECDRLIKVADSYISNQSYVITGDCYLLCRKDIHDVDLDVQQIMNAQEIDDQLAQLFNSHIIEDVFEARIGERVVLRNISIKIDNPDTNSKRGYHTDTVTKTVYKVFIYLTDVNECGNGPYTVIPGSHRHTYRRIINYFYGWIKQVLYGSKHSRNYKEDIQLLYSDRQSVPLLAPAGTMIISNQQIVHKGWHQQDKSTRYALVCYVIPAKDYHGQRFSFGRTALQKGVEVISS
ncbi:phytanoyl-CoA dioxygenase family protein [Chroogloeocystis siderophila]|jgi:hypothetical protein|uniref:Phytanoyl-CoA dioxygenase n=1 Tax=Chroogloeocystis siderophila 5.2 s.c.1 TaxID=247279 RepID=A0A1U7HH70_9CHRO|nr:phytanoyl-CoA dioxygenase family protein [Chroogloeocystis siderophila]OKH22878.1 hypothetical protein NIES1031_19125 [Chroogloeocystis siderophila 5.2 s.c.1]